MFRVLRTFGLALGLLGGAAAAQGPEFAQQYTQRLGGALDELRRAVATLDADAQATGTSREGALDRLNGNADPLVMRRGAAARRDVERLANLSEQKQVLDGAGGPLGRLLALMRGPDLDLARATYGDFRPAVPTTTDGFVAGALGFLAVWGLLRVLTDLGRRLARRRRPATA